jgi:septum formation protein
MDIEIILASGSPRRKQLLEQAEVKFKVVVSAANEDFNADMPLNEIPIFIATNKAKAVQAFENNNKIIVAADTIVHINNEILGKPTDEADAINIIEKLNGKTHQVITGVCVLYQNKILTLYDVTEVHFNKLSKEQIIHYVQHYKPYDKAGAYAIQEWIGVIGIAGVNGCFYNVMGLPVSKTLALIEAIKK